MANLKSFKLYPRGFLGAEIGSPVAINPPPFLKQISELTPNFKVSEKIPVFISPNPEVETLYETIINDPQALKRFEFRKQVLLVALRAFGTTSFYNWYLIQAKSVNFGPLHSRFLDDTMSFIMGNERSCHLHTWKTLVNNLDTKNPINVSEDISPMAVRFFNLSSSDQRVNILLEDVLQAWTSQPTGFADLVQTLHLFFGKY